MTTTFVNYPSWDLGWVETWYVISIIILSENIKQRWDVM